MKFGVVTIGSRGDVEPFIALGKELHRRGHKLRIATFDDCKGDIIANGLDYQKLAGSGREVLRLLIGENVSAAMYMKNLNVLLESVKDEFLRDVERACDGVDVVLYSFLGSVVFHVAQKREIPCFRVLFFPMDPTGDWPVMTVPQLPFGSIYNKVTYKASDLVFSEFTYRQLGDWRVSLGLERLGRFSFNYRESINKPVTTLYPISPTVMEKPKEWGPNTHLTDPLGVWLSFM